MNRVTFFQLLSCYPVSHCFFFFFSSRRRHTRWPRDWSSDVCSSDLENVFVMGDTVDLPVSKAGGTCHNQSPVIANNIAGLIRIGHTVAEFDGKVQAIAQMGFSAGMPLWYDYDDDVIPLPATRIGSMMRNGFNRGVYWGVARGMV